MNECTIEYTFPRKDVNGVGAKSSNTTLLSTNTIRRIEYEVVQTPNRFTSLVDKMLPNVMLNFATHKMR